MPPGDPNPRALFSLVPLNDRARGILTYRENHQFVSSFPLHKDNPTVKVQGLDIGINIATDSNYTLAILGRESHIKLDDPGLSLRQCSFELHTGHKREVMLKDHSDDGSTQVFGPTAVPLNPENPYRRVLLDRKINLQFGFGGASHDLYQFQIFWHDESIHNRLGNSSNARTISYELPTSASRLSFDQIRYLKRRPLGRGTFGEVWKVANVDTGEHLAVKRINTLRSDSSQSLSLLKREVDMLSRVSHRNIIKCITSQTADDGRLEIFMELRPGSVQNLIDERHGFFEVNQRSGHDLLWQMLEALDYLANEGMIHRDVKPENILFTSSPGPILYQLADFGVANLADNAQTYAGTESYMAPEVYPDSGEPQTVKMDVWSLFVTAAYAMNAAGYRGKPRHTREQRFTAVSEAANWEGLRLFREMAIKDPNLRATARDMLDKVFQGRSRGVFQGQSRGVFRN